MSRTFWMKIMKNKLAYSKLTDTVQWVDGRGKATDCSQNFIQIMLLWFHEASSLMKVGEKYHRELRFQGKVKWRFTIERVSE